MRCAVPLLAQAQVLALLHGQACAQTEPAWCPYVNDGACDVPSGRCEPGTDCADCPGTQADNTDAACECGEVCDASWCTSPVDGTWAPSDGSAFQVSNGFDCYAGAEPIRSLAFATIATTARLRTITISTNDTGAR